MMSQGVINTWPDVTFFLFFKKLFPTHDLIQDTTLKIVVYLLMLTQNAVLIRFRKVIDDGLLYILIQKC